MIDRGLGPTWPDEVRDSSKRFLQGHLVKAPPFFYGADLRYPVWGATRLTAEETSEEERGEDLIDVIADERPSYGIITTQSCDLAEENPRPRQPWFSVAPVYRVDDDDSVLRGEFVYRLDPPAVDGDTWIADLRVEFPLEKSLLVGRRPIDSFPDEEGYVGFANFLARRRGRPALANVFHAILNETTESLRRESNARRKQARRVRARVYKLKLDITDGTRLQPDVAQLYVVTDGPRDEGSEDWFGAWWDRARVVAEDHGLQLLPVRWIDATALNVREYDRLVELRSPI